MWGIAACFLLGVALGVASSVVPGPCGLAILDGAVRGVPIRRGVATACGGALADVVYASLGVAGLAPLLARDPVLPNVVQLCSGGVLIAYGTVRLVARTHRVPREAAPPHGQARRGVLVGFSLVAGNPAALVTWVVVVGSLLATASAAERWAAIAGIGVGTASWFTGLAYAARRGAAARRVPLQRLARALGAVLVGYGALTVLQAMRSWSTG